MSFLLKMSCDTRLLVYTATQLLLYMFIFTEKSNHCDALISGKYNFNEHQHIFNSDNGNLNRQKREVDITGNNASDNVAASDINVTSLITLVNLNDSHEQLTVHWAGKNSPEIISLARNRKLSRRNQSSAVYISHDYGKTFNRISDFKLKDGSPAIISTFYISPVVNSFYIFVAENSNCIFITKDTGNNFQRIDLNFKPKQFQLHPTVPNFVLASSTINNSSDSSLYVTENFGFSWKKIHEKIGYFSWDIEGAQFDQDFRTVFVLRNEPNGLATLISSYDFFTNFSTIKVWVNNVEEVELNGKYIFATRRFALIGTAVEIKNKPHALRGSHQLWISVNRKDFYRAIIPSLSSNSLNILNYHIAVADPEIVFLAVTFQNGTTNLYTSDPKCETFTLSLENILYFNSKITKNLPSLNSEAASGQEFSELHRVSGIRGIYIVSKWRNATKKSSVSDIVSLITWDMGRRWSPIKEPKFDSHGNNLCSTNCSLHLVQKYVSLQWNLKPILTRESSPGFIIATGVTGESLKGQYGTHLSTDAGSTWRQVLPQPHLYAFGDHGSIIVAVMHYSKGGTTNELKYSMDDGQTWLTLTLGESLRIYGLLTEPGERTTVFTIFGSKAKSHEWIVIQANFSSLFHSQCQAPIDYKEWSPHDFESECLLGSTQIFQRKIATKKCFNGDNFQRVTSQINCPCKWSDYECEAGYLRDHYNSGSFKCIPDNTFGDTLDLADLCKPGRMFNRTRGYRKVAGNTCEGGEEDFYSPQLLPCPLSANESEFILFVQRQDISMISLNSEEFSKNSLVPKSFLTNAIAADFDVQKSCIFWSDISFHRIMRLCLNGTQIQPEVLVESELYSVEGVAFNQINRHLYFVNGFKSKIELIDVDAHREGRMRRTIITKPDIDKPRGIAVDPIGGYLFITDWSTSNPAIVKSELDGENIQILFNSGTVIWPNGITVDQQNRLIFWVDAKLDFIASSNYDGKEFKYILRGEHTPHPFALGVFKDVIFYDDWNLHKLMLVSRHNSTIRREILNGVTGAMDLKIITQFYANMSNGCTNNTCEHLCIAKPVNSFRCLCPDGLVSIQTPDGNEKCLCPPDEEMTSTGACKPLLPSVTCGPDEFKCANGNCISNQWTCDGESECGDGSDEDAEHCKVNEHHNYENPIFNMDNLPAISNISNCSDEGNCSGVNETNVTTPKSNLIPHSGNCPDDWLQCQNGICIPLEWHCDGFKDCDSDELGCYFDHTNVTPQVTNGTNHSDSCGHNKFFCHNSNQCILSFFECDGDRDCLEGEDEPESCKANFNYCPSGTFSCILKAECIPIGQVCDSVSSCSDGSDEWGCVSEKLVNSICLGFSCKSGECISHSMRCDNKSDCFDDSDEENCDEKVYHVDELHLVNDSITGSSFTIAWSSPNASLKFLYLPAYAHYADEDSHTAINTSWTDSTNYTFTQLLSGNTYKVYIFCKLVDLDKVYSPVHFIKVSTASVAPRPPQDFTAEEIGYNRVLLKWKAPMINEPIKGYKIWYTPPYPAIRKILDYKTQQYELSGLFAIGVNYTFWITTLTKNLESADSNKVSLMIEPVASISLIQQKDITNSTVLLEWKSTPKQISKWFIIYRCDEYFPTFVKNLTTYKNEALVSNLSPGVNYQFKLYPIVNNTIMWDGVQDNMISVRTRGRQLPSILVNSTVSRGELDSVVLLNWSAPTHYNGVEVDPTEWKYAVYVGYTTSDLKLFAKTRDTNVVLRNLFSCSSYIAQVRVVEPFGIGPAQDSHQFKTSFFPTSPPKNLKASSVNDENITYKISWENSCGHDVNEKVGYIVSVYDTIVKTEDRFRFQPSSDILHSFELSVHYGAIYLIKACTDASAEHPRWTDTIVLQPPSLPRVQKPRAFMDEKGSLHIMWKTINYYPKDYQTHKFQYKVFVSTEENVLNGNALIVQEPPAVVHLPAAKVSRFYFAVSLLDNHGYSGPISDISSCPTSVSFFYSTPGHPGKDLFIFSFFLSTGTLVALIYFVAKKVFSRSTPFIANSHYNSRSDSATLASYDNLTDLEEANVYSDDEPLVTA